MFSLSLFFGFFSYVLFFLGVLGLLQKQIVFLLSILFLITFSFIFCKRVYAKKIENFLSYLRNDRLSLLLFFLIVLQLMVNLVGALGPELSFDALWYHLTIPKIMLAKHSLLFIPGSLRYYSLMPKLLDMIYIPALVLQGEILVKLIHLVFGLLSVLALYKLSRIFLSIRFSLFACIIFYANLVVGWESITAYIDLGRTFFEILALYYFFLFVKKKREIFLWMSSFVLGLAIATKPLAIGSLGIFVILLIIECISQKKQLREIVKYTFFYIIISLAISLPWYLFALIHIDSNFYSFLNLLYRNNSQGIFNIFTYLRDLFILFTQAADPVNPIYIILLPFIFLRNSFKTYKLLYFYSFLALLIWCFTPRTGGGRFILPYLPAFSLLSAGILSLLQKSKTKFYQNCYRLLFALTFIVAAFSIGYRFIANEKFLSVILSKESKAVFLNKNLNFTFGDFYDVDGFFEKKIKSDKVLLYGFHNLNYLTFKYIDAIWVQEGDTFTYIATQDAFLPQRFHSWKKIYQNKKTHVSVYTNNRKIWRY